LKHAFYDNVAWILSYRDECFEQIGLKADERVPLFNGALECEFRKYRIFGGKYEDFKKTEKSYFNYSQRKED
jgi:putative N6-adenine-specific DNA methylase